MNQEIHSILHRLSPNACFLLVMILAHNDDINTLQKISLNPKKHEFAIKELIHYRILAEDDKENWIYWVNLTVIWELTKYNPKSTIS